MAGGRWVILVAVVAGCDGRAKDGGSDEADETWHWTAGDGDTVFLSPADHLVRASMALRGIRPDEEEMEAVLSEPDKIADYVDQYLVSAEFDEAIRDLHAETFLTRVENVFLPPVYELEGRFGAEINRSMMEEPLRLIEYVVKNDRPYSEIVTADYTLADKIVADIWGLAYEGDGEEWVVTRWDDGDRGSTVDDRPMAGILSSTALFARHDSNGTNYHRGRANMVSSTLLCFDFLTSDVVIDGSIDLSDPDVVAEAVVENPSCAGCHQTLDPLASFFWGYQGQVPFAQLRNNADAGQDIYPVDFYRVTRESLWENTTGRAPSFFGIPGTNLQDLGALIAADSRFSSCAARRFFSYMAQVPLDDVPLSVVAELQDAFVGSGLNARRLAREVVLSDAFRVSHSTDAAEAETLVGLKKARPEQLRRMLLDLTGFEWKTDVGFNAAGYPFGLVDIPVSDVIGLRTLAGGIDGSLVTTPSHTFNATSGLFLQTFAANAAAAVVESDFALADPAARRLLTVVSATEQGESAVRAQLALLHRRLFAEFVEDDAEEVDETYDLFAGALARSGDVETAWKATLTAMLQDTRIAFF